MLPFHELFEETSFVLTSTQSTLLCARGYRQPFKSRISLISQKAYEISAIVQGFVNRDETRWPGTVLIYHAGTIIHIST